jgi:hypothetical protein
MQTEIHVGYWLAVCCSALTGMIGEQSYSGEIRPIEVHSVRVCRRTAPDGSSKSTLVIELTQTFRADPDQTRYRGGCTLLFDLTAARLDYVVRKRLLSPAGGDESRGGRRAGLLSG